MPSRRTKELVRLIESRASLFNSPFEAQRLIDQGADIKEPTKNGSMIASVTAEKIRQQQLSPEKAQYCEQLIQVLKKRASDLLINCVFSADGGNVDEMKQLVQLSASCHQEDRFGPLGLVGELLKQEKIPIRLDVVQILIESDIDAKLGVTKIDNQQQTYLSLSKNNSKCPTDLQGSFQNTFDMLLNRAPYEYRHIDINEIVAWIHRGANPEFVNENQNTVLSNAVLTNNLELVRALVGAGCDVTHVNKENFTPLDIAKNATPRNAQMVAVLEAQNINNELKQTIEIRKSSLTVDEVKSLLHKGANINATLPNNRTFLHLLIANEGTSEMIMTFVNNFNADISAVDIRGHRPLELCILHDKSPFDNLRTYLRLERVSTAALFNTQLNKSILEFAKEQSCPEAVEIVQNELNHRLWNIVARANTRDEDNENLKSELKQLIDCGADIEHVHTDKEYKKWTVLHLACKTTTRSFVQYLIDEFKANYRLPNGDDDYLISIAAEFGHLSIVEYLHGRFNLKLNVSNTDKQTPLHLATKNNHLFVVRYLVLWGADHEAKNINNQTPLDIARTNSSKNKTDETTDKTLVHFLEQLICPVKSDQEQDHSTTSNYELNTCELVKPITVYIIQKTNLGSEEIIGLQSKSIFSGTPNDHLVNGAKEGFFDRVQQAIGEGADICYRKGGRNAYETAQQAIREYDKKIKLGRLSYMDLQLYQQKLVTCQQIANEIRQLALKKLKEGIDQSKAYHVVAYHQAGAPLTGDLLYYACSNSDNVQIVDYLIKENVDIHQTMFNYLTDDSPYRIARKNKFNNVASYLKYRLSDECTKAIKNNDTEHVRKLIRAGASADLFDTNNLQVALRNCNTELIEILCDKGAKLPVEWIQSETIVLPENVAQTMDSNTVSRIDRCLVNHRLRIAAAAGDLATLTHCQHLGADINSENCHGSTAVLCSIQHGNYFPIVHALISRGATMLHSNDNESMSLIALTREHKYIQIAEYLSEKLNSQFLTAILNNDQKSAQKFEELGADFNYQDEQKRTPLHYAVQRHGFELVKWLCDRGSTPTISDINGNYPIMEAAGKGFLYQV